MSSLTIRRNGSNSDFSSTSGTSEISRDIKSATETAIGHFRTSFTNRTPQDLLNEDLLQVFLDCQEANWDGYDAVPVSKASLEAAESFTRKIDNLPIPDVSAHPDGEIAFDWYGQDAEVFSMSFGAAGEVFYAGYFDGGSVLHGREKIDSLDVAFIERLIRRVL